MPAAAKEAGNCCFASKMARSFLWKLVADPCLNDDRLLACLDDDGVGAEQDAVLIVGRRALLPQGLGDDAEHGSAIEVVRAVAQNCELKLAKLRAPANQNVGIRALRRMWHTTLANRR